MLNDRVKGRHKWWYWTVIEMPVSQHSGCPEGTLDGGSEHPAEHRKAQLHLHSSESPWSHLSIKYHLKICRCAMKYASKSPPSYIQDRKKTVHDNTIFSLEQTEGDLIIGKPASLVPAWMFLFTSLRFCYKEMTSVKVFLQAQVL